MNFTAKTDGERGFYGEDLEMMAGSSNRANSSHQYPYYHQHEFMEASPSTTRETEEPNESELGLGTGGSGGGAAAAVAVEREHMFDKVVTPSDVGKLNRLVIPKQYAEKYFPLDSSSNEKGLLLNFEDRNGKPWRFRYSYWNSSQSYVMTKGWSRFVKEKKLDAGDIVSFQRGAAESDKDRLFIDWRRRPDAPPPHPFLSSSHPQQQYLSFHNHHHNRPTQYLWNSNQNTSIGSSNNYHHHLLSQQQLLHPNSNHHPHFPHHHPHYGQFGYGSVVSNPVIYVRSSSVMPVVPQMSGGVSGSIGGGGGGVEPMVFDSVPVVHGKAAAKRLRLFGVNMDCPISDSEECNILSSSAISPPQVSSSPIHPLQLRLYNDSSSSNSQVHQQNSQEHKGKGSNSKSLDLDIN